MPNLDVWRRPWAFHSPRNQDATTLANSVDEFEIAESGMIWIATDIDGGPGIDGKKDVGERVATLPESDGRRVYAIPTALSPSKGIVLLWPDRRQTRLRFPQLPDKPPGDPDPGKRDISEGDLLRARIKRIWARLREVEEAIADPGTMWSRLRDLWLDPARNDDPRMDVIVKQARRLRSVIDQLDRSPRRILRRVHEQTPLSRVQEVDRHSLTWLIRQPGETIAERAGDRQRISAVVRTENFNTLENRVVLSYARLAAQFAREYAPSGLKRAPRQRELLVRAFGKRCNQIATDFAGLNVLTARSDATPNFVLQNNPSYHAIWEAWRELLEREPVLDDLWRWQGRSWEEYCALALVVTLQSIDGAEVIATSPTVFRQEQFRGRWIENVNPLAVVHLREQGLIVEVQYLWRRDHLATFGAAIWLRAGALANAGALLSRFPIWPVWDTRGGLVDGETRELDAVVARGSRDNLRGGVVVRPHVVGAVTSERGERSVAVTLGDSGEALKDGIQRLATELVELLVRKVDR